MLHSRADFMLGILLCKHFSCHSSGHLLQGRDGRIGWLLWQRAGRAEARDRGQRRIAANNAGAAAGRRANSYARQVRLPLGVRG